MESLEIDTIREAAPCPILRWQLATNTSKGYVRVAMVTQEYRYANELADLIDFFDGITDTENDRRVVAGLRADLAKQEEFDGKPADPASQRRGFTGAI